MFVGIGVYVIVFLMMWYGVLLWFVLIVGVVLMVLVVFVLGVVMMWLFGYFLLFGMIVWGFVLFYLFGNFELFGKYDGINGILVLNLFGIEFESGCSLYFLIWVVVLVVIVLV